MNRAADWVKPISLSKDNPEQLVDALTNDNLFWRMTAQRLLVERGNLDVLPELYGFVKNEKLDDEGYNSTAVHALWIIDGLGAIGKDDKAEAVVTSALNHPSAAVRKAAIQILSKLHWTEEAVTKSKVLNDKDPNTRLAAIVSLAEIAPSESLGKTLYELSLEESIKSDEWLSKAVYAAANQHKKGFIDSFLAAHPDYLQKKTSEKKREAANLDDATWKSMELPQYIEKAGLNIDGVIWFRKTINLSTGAGKKATLSLGPINDSDITYINGVKVGGIEKKHTDKRVYEVSAGVLKTGRNVIIVRVEDIGGNGGIYGKPEEMFIQIGGKKISLAGNWKFEVEREYGTKSQSVFKDISIGELFADNYAGKLELNEPSGATADGATTVIKIKVIKNEMKYDLKSFTVEAGKPVEIVFENPDFMQHNLVIAQIGALETVGKAADKLASDPKGAERQYVPDIPEVLFATKLINPQKSEKLLFVAPQQVGDYPYVCTFPGHWAIMNGVMKVVAAK